jgi:iron(III) transport system substrate-binding protein
MAAGLKRAFGIDLTIKFDNALSFPASTAKALSEVKAGGAPSYDLMYQTSLSGVPLFADNLVEPFDWLKTFNWLTEKDLEYKGHALINNTQFILPAYNTTLVKPADIPKTWEDVVDPKWKGKLSSTIYQDSWAQMAEPQVWGEERTLEYVKKLAALEPKLGRFPEVSAMVVSGETPLTALNHTYRTNAEKANGAPVEIALVEPAIVFINVTFVPKGARHPNAAALLSAWFLSEEGQALMEQGWTASSMFKPATPAAKFAEGKKLAVPTLDFQMKNTVRLQKQYEDIVIKK